MQQLAPHRWQLLVGAGLATILLAVGQGRPEWPVYLVVTILGGLVVVGVVARWQVSPIATWGLVAFGVGHLAGGMIGLGETTLYGLWLWEPVIRYDNVQHAIGFGAVGRTLWEVLRPRLGALAAARWLMALLVISLGTLAGVVNEIVEWILTLTIPGTDVGGYDNTARDLVANLVGVSVWAAATVRWPPARTKQTLPDVAQTE